MATSALPLVLLPHQMGVAPTSPSIELACHPNGHLSDSPSLLPSSGCDFPTATSAAPMGTMSHTQCCHMDTCNECPLPWNRCNDHAWNMCAVMTHCTTKRACMMPNSHWSLVIHSWHPLPSNGPQQAHTTTRSTHRHEAQWFSTVGPSHPSRCDAKCLMPNASV